MRIAIIGGGISGLAAAHFLARGGHEVVCIEPSPDPGGLIRSERTAGFLCEAGPQALLDGPADTRALVALAGLEPRTLRAAPAARRRFIYARGRLHPLPTDPLALARTDLLTWRGKLRLLREPFLPAAPPAIADHESVLDFGTRRFGAEASRALLATAVIGIYAGDAAQLSMKSALPRIAALESARGSVIRGAIAQRRAGGAGIGRPISFPDGLQELPRALAERLGTRRVAGRAVGLARAGDGWRVTIEPGAAPVDAQAVVIAANPGPAAALLEPLAPAAAAALRAVPLAPAAVVCLGFQPPGPQDQPLGMDLRAYGFLVARGAELGAADPPEANPAPARAGADPLAELAILGCQYESSIFAERAPPGGVLLRAILGGTFAPGIVAQSDQAVAARAVDELQRIAGLRRQPDLVRVWRYPAGIPQYDLAHAGKVAAVDADLRRHPGLFLIGNALRGVGLNDCIAAAAALPRQMA